jgi:2-octaprenyl-6-methoxyphenol hydroxylase
VRRAEVAIAGAGPVGCALALALERLGRPCVLCGGPPAGGPFRPIALSHASRLILERIGAWEGLGVTPIERIHVSQARAFGRTRIDAADAGVPALGHVLDYGELGAALYAQAIAARGVRTAPEPPPAALLVHAEGHAADANEKRYGQEALVARVRTRPGAGTTAFERFTPDGPLALLPLAGSYGVVWAMRPERAQALAAAGDEEFLAALGEAFGGRAGAFVAAGARSRVALALRVRPSRIGEREAFIGNTAQTLHPVAGQGLNLGLRDAWDLACLLQDAPDPGDARLLARYAAARALDARATIGITDLLAGAFASENPLFAAARGVAMTALDAFAPARRLFARRMIFGAHAMP